MEYQITGPDFPANNIIMSPFGARKEPFTETDSSGKEFIVPAGKTLGDVAKIYYPSAAPRIIQLTAGFMTRDNKQRAYSPASADPFVFSGADGIRQFKNLALKHIDSLLTKWVALGLPVKYDKIRRIDVVDDDKLWELIRTDPVVRRKVADNYETVCFLSSNFDIAKKACVVRSVTYGWWVVSYTGKDAKDISYFSRALDVMERSVDALLRSDKCKQLANHLWRTAGDPIDTNPGYPFFRGNVNSDGFPVTRAKTVELFKHIVTAAEQTVGGRKGIQWASILSVIDTRAAHLGLEGHPLAVGPLRRLQPNFKPNHQFRLTDQGMITAYDERGGNTQRVAFMVPYVYNILITPAHCWLKAVRMLLPGMYHDGPARTKRLAFINQMHKSGGCYMAEADYTNYDRFMPVDIVRRITHMFAKRFPESSYWQDAMMHLHDGASLIWPDYQAQGDPVGIVFKPGKLGLLSGVKLTSETGSFVNYVINLAAVMKSRDWTDDQALTYCLQYSKTPFDVGKGDWGTGGLFEHFYVQSDDTLLLASTFQDLIVLGDAFREAAIQGGLKGSVIVGDRFLMRHMFGGWDLPVPARCFQNSISNEAPVRDAAKFVVGMVSRTDGLAGYKSIDPFETGARFKVCAAHSSFALEVIRDIRDIVLRARHPLPQVINFLRLYEQAIISKFPLSLTSQIDAARKEAVLVLAKQELAANLKASDFQGMVYSLLRDKHQPASALLLRQLLDGSPALRALVAQIQDKEHSFFLYASRTIGVTELHCS